MSSSSPSTHYGTLLVVGSGPGIGRNVPKLFGSRGFKQVILLSRDATRLQDDTAYVKAAAQGIQVHTIPTDVSKKQSVSDALTKVETLIQDIPLQVVLYNAARVGVSKFFEFGVTDIEEDLAITVTSLYTFASFAIPKMQQLASSSSSNSLSSTKPAFLVTSGLLSKEPFPHLFSLSTCKAAQASLMHSLYKEFGPKGVHCALVTIGGYVSDDSKVTTASRVAEEFWGLFQQQPREEWKKETVLLDQDYDEMIRGRERSGDTW